MIEDGSVDLLGGRACGHRNAELGLPFPFFRRAVIVLKEALTPALG